MYHRLPHLATGLAALSAAAVLAAPAHADYLGAIGAPGAPGPATLEHPWAVATGADGRVYVADSHRVSVFDSAGAPITQFGSIGQPSGIAVDGTTVLVSDRASSKVLRFTTAGVAAGTFGGGPGVGPGQFQQPGSIALGRAVAGGHEVLVASAYRFARFSPGGTFLSGRGAAGSGPGQFNGIAGIAVGPDGSIYTSDTVDDKIERFNADQSFNTSWFGYKTPTGLAFDPQANELWIADRIDGVSHTKPDGTPLGPLNATGEGKLVDPTGVAIDCRGTVYVADQLAGHVQKYGAKAAAVAGNLLRNGSFEEGGGSCSTTRADRGAGPAWSSDASTSTTHYGADGGFPGRAVGDGVSGGESFLAGGTAPTAVVDQVVDVSAQALDIDDGRRAVTLSGLLGGFANQDDAATVEAIARNAAGQSIGTLAIGPVTAADRGGQTGLLARSASATLPAGTRSIRVRVTLRRAVGGGAYDDAYVDNLALTLTPQRPAALPPITGTPGTGTGTTPPSPRGAPRANVTLSLVGAKQTLRTRHLVARASCDRACTLTLSARPDGHRVTTRRLVLRAAGPGRVSWTLSRHYAAALRRAAKPSIRVAVRGGRSPVAQSFDLR